MTEKVQVSGEVPGKAGQRAEGARPPQFGLITAMALIVGSIIGAGIFNLPGFSALAQLKWRWIDHKTMHTPRFARDMIVAALSLVFSVLFIIYSRNTGHSFWIYWAPFFLAAGALLLGIPVYLAQRRHLTEPAPVPPYRWGDGTREEDR